MKLKGRILVPASAAAAAVTSSRSGGSSSSSNVQQQQQDQDVNHNNHKSKSKKAFPILASNTSLSFWGGIDPLTGIVIDTTHPLAGQCVSDKILCLPTGRGSCTASQVLLELILNHKAPAALILRDIDPLVCIGAIVAQEIIFIQQQHDHDHGNDVVVVVPPIVCLGHDNYEQLLLASAAAEVTAESHSEEINVSSNTTTRTSLVGFVGSGGNKEDAYLYIGESMQAILQEQAQEEEEEAAAAVKLLSHSNAGDDDVVVVMNDDSTTAVLQQQLQLQLQLSTEEIQRLQNASSDAERMALRVIYRYARIMMMMNHSYDNNNKKNHQYYPTYVPISQAHIDGCTYIGPGGLQFVQTLVQASSSSSSAAGGSVGDQQQQQQHVVVKVPTTLNAISTDRQQWKALGVPSSYATNAIAVGNAYLELGCQPSFTCAPYLLLLPGISNTNSNSSSNSSHGTQVDTTTSTTNTTKNGNAAASILSACYQGQNWAWGESNAVVFANSVLGARTEKTADYLDICEAIAGIVPKEGVYLDKNREPTILLDARDFIRGLEMEMEQSDCSIKEDLHSLFPVLGHLCGTLSDGRVPLLIGLENGADWITLDHLKSFCAAFGTTGTSPLIHIAGITPEARNEQVVKQWIRQCEDRVAEVTAELLRATYNILDKDKGEKIDLIALGNPHLSVDECGDLLDLVQRSGENPQKHPDVRVIACLSRSVQAEAEKSGHIHPLKQFGVEFVNDTCWCMLLDPPVIPARNDATILTNSGKYAHYGPGLTQRRFRFGSMADCVRTATTGRYAKHASTHPIWFPSNYYPSRSYHTMAATATTTPIRCYGNSYMRTSATRALVLARMILRKLP